MIFKKYRIVFLQISFIKKTNLFLRSNNRTFQKGVFFIIFQWKSYKQKKKIYYAT